MRRLVRSAVGIVLAGWLIGTAGRAEATDERGEGGWGPSTTGARPTATRESPGEITCADFAGRGAADSSTGYFVDIGEQKKKRKLELQVFKGFEGDYLPAVPPTIPNPWRNSKVRFTPAKSLKFVAPEKEGDNAQHFVEVKLPPDAAVLEAAPPPKIPFTLRVISSVRGLYRLDLKELAATYRAGRYAMDVRIIWDEIDAGGLLKKARPIDDLAGFAEVPVSPERLELTVNEADNLFQGIELRLSETRSEGPYDRVLLITGNWSIPYQVIPRIQATAAAGRARGQHGKWLNVLSERTAAAGNAFLRAALETTGIGTLTEDRSTDGNGVLMPHEQFLRDIEDASRGKAIREGTKQPAAPRRELVTEANAADLRGGHVMATKELSTLVEALGRLGAALGESDPDAPDANGSIQQLLEKGMRGFSLPGMALRTVRQPIRTLSKQEREELQQRIEDAAKHVFFSASALPPKCSRAFVPDRLLGLGAAP